MSVKVLNKYDDWVKVDSTVVIKANSPAMIMRAEPPKKMAMIIQEHPMLFLSLRDSSGNKLPPQTKVILAGIDQAHDLPFQLTPAHYLRSWNDIDYTLQKNEKYIHNFIIDLRSDVVIEEKEQLLIVLITPTDVTLDWSQSDFELEVEAVTMEELAAMGYAGSEFFVEDYEDYEEHE